MKQYKEIRRIRKDELSNLCMEKGWYIFGDNDSYMYLLYDLCELKENLTTDDIIKIAEDIMEHSGLDDEYTLTDVAFEVAKIATVVFEEK